MSVLGTGARNEAEALGVDLLHVVPPLWLFVNSGEILVQAALSQVLKNNVLTSDSIEVILNVVRCAVFTIREALFVFELFGASWTSPRDKSWLDLDVSCQLMRVPIKLLDEIQSSLVVRTVPEFDVSPFTLFLDCELGRERRSSLFLCKLNKHLSIGFTNEHGRDTDSCAGAIVAHDHVGDVLDLRVDDDEQAGAGPLCITHLVDEGAASTLRDEYLRREGLRLVTGLVLIQLLHVLRSTLRAHVRVVSVVVDCANL